jgi:hypothetical protein
MMKLIPNPGISLTIHKRSFFFMIHEIRRLQDASDFIEAWHWLARAVRKPTDQRRFSVSDVIYTLGPAEKDAKDSASRVHGRLTMAPASDMEPSCWQALFKYCTMLPCKSVLRGSFGKGLKASFDLLLSLAAIELCCTIEGGVVFVGYRTLIYPTAIENDCAQFHLLTCNVGQINPYKLEYENRLLTEDWQQFKTMRCYLGWCTNAQINLGTERLSPSTISYTGAPENEKSLQPIGFTALFQAGASNPLTMMGGLEKNFRYESHIVRFTPFNNYTHLLRDAAKETAMLYDSGSKRCWLVPKLSLLLHMCQAYASYYPDIPADRIPFVVPHTDALDLISHLTPLGATQIHSDGQSAFLFRELLHGLSMNLLNTRQATKLSKKKALYGFEFMDIVTQPGRGSCMKQLSLHTAGKTWFELADAVDAVVVCTGAGDVVTASNGPTQCSTLPENCDYLAATVSVLETLAKRQGNCVTGSTGPVKLGKKTYWQLQSDPFTSCKHTGSSEGCCWDKREVWQQLSSAQGNVDKLVERFVSKQAVGVDTTQIPKTGAVAFGTWNGKSV